MMIKVLSPEFLALILKKISFDLEAITKIMGLGHLQIDINLN